MSSSPLRTRLEVVDLLLQGVPTQSVLEQVCRTIEAQGAGLFCCILIADTACSYLYGCAAPSLPPEFSQALTRVPIAERGSLCGRAAWSRSRLAVDSVFQEPDLEALLPILQRAGVDGCWCEPILDGDNRLLGTFTVLVRQDLPLQSINLSLLEDGADLTRFTLRRAHLRQRQRLLERAYNATEAAICFCAGLDPSAPIQMVNGAFCRLLGGSQEALHGLSLLHLLDEAADLLEQTERYGKASAITLCRRVDESFLHCEVSLQAVADDYGQTSHILVTIADLTRKMEVDQARQESEARFRRIFEEVPHVAVRGCAADGAVRFWNSASQRIFGYSSQEAIGSHLPRRVESFDNSSNEYELLRKDGRLVPVFGASVAISTPGVGMEIYTLEIDLTPLKEAEKERIQLLQLLSRAQRMEALGQLTEGIAHDFINVLAVILGNLELARTEPDPGLLDEIQVAAERANDLIGRLLTHNHPHPSKGTATLLEEPIREVCRILAAVIPSTVQLHLDLAPRTPAALLDPTELHQILASLVINSRDALGDKGSIEVGLRSIHLETEVICSSCQRIVRGSWVELWVQDSGPGIEDGIRGRLFSPFFTTKGVEGSGLGLAVLHRLVHERGGHVVISPGPGARFGVFLQPAGAPQPLTPPPSAVGNIQPVVMVIDDEPMLARLLGKLLKMQGYQAQVFTDSELAWSEFAANPLGYSAVITDLSMSGRTGDAFARDALALRPDIPILLCSGFSEKIDAQAARAMGIRYFFQKPVKPAVLFEALASLIQPG